MNLPEIEKKILKFWEKNKIFEKLRKKIKTGKRWSFLDGPITANNPMGVHHAWGRTYKDLFQRYKALQGFNQRFQNGFDCQGLWVEVEVEKELGFKTKKDIEKYGIAKFVEKCKERVFKYAKIQTEQSIRLGQWMDWPNSYYTMSDENNYAIWRFLKKCWQKGYLYKGRDSVPWCPRCGTAISQHEILTEEYKEITHESIYFRLPVLDRDKEYFLVWTTTPWTLIANIAVAVDKNLRYALVEDSQGFKNWVAKDLVEKIFGKKAKIVKTARGKELVGLRYSFAFDSLPRVKEVAFRFSEKFHLVVATDQRIMPVTTEEGTGFVHTAVSAGQEDFQLGKKLGLPLIEVIDEEANYLQGLGEFSGKNAKKDPKIILEYLASKKSFVFKIEPYKHRYPTCWRCKTELVWRVVDEWYISMDKLRGPLQKSAKKINWIPSFGLERELDWLKNMQDWLISKKRYWGLALPIFECQQCGNFEVIGSKEELKKRAVEGWDELEGHSPHRPWVDRVKIKCGKCGKIVSRIKDVGNPWLDAGIVPFSTMPKEWFPADLVCESFPGQFKNWFYSIIVMSQVMAEGPSVKTIFGYASVRDEKGEEMHKSKGNAIWFDEAVERVGADLMRWMYTKQNPEYNLLFGWKALDEVRKTFLTLYNCFIFFATYFDISSQKLELQPKTKNLLDRWVISVFHNLIEKVTDNLNKYNAAGAGSAIEKFFIEDLSLWYVRRSRPRFQRPKNKEEKRESAATLYYVLLNLLKLMAPLTPFFSEELYQKIRQKKMPESIHLYDWPKVNKQLINQKLEEKMIAVRQLVTQALAERAKVGIKIRQPLSELQITNLKLQKEKDLLELIQEEVSVKKITFGKTLKLNTKITPELREEGFIREVIRNIQDLRKEAGFVPGDKISIIFRGSQFCNRILEKNRKTIEQETLSNAFHTRREQEKDLFLAAEKEVRIGQEKLYIGIKKNS